MPLQSSGTTTPDETPESVGGIVEQAVDGFVGDVTGALPELLAGLVFLILAAVLVKAIMTVVNYALRRVLPGESPVYRQFLSTIVSVVLWFGVALSFLSVVGLRDIAAALGTASGFLALGVAYALSDMIEDAVAGIYLLRDPDFNPGDTITSGDTTGEIQSIELRKTRIGVEGDTVVRANAELEKRWTRREVEDGEGEGSTDPGVVDDEGDGADEGDPENGADGSDADGSDAGTGTVGENGSGSTGE